MIALRSQDVDFENNRIFFTSAYVRRQLKTIKTKSGKREVTLQPQAKEALVNQQTHTKALNETVFHDPDTNQPWRNDQPIRKKIWILAVKKAHIKYRNSYQTRHTFASTLLSRGEIPYELPSKWGIRTGGKSSRFMGDGFRRNKKLVLAFY